MDLVTLALSKKYTKGIIENVSKLTYVKVDSLPTTGEVGNVYLVPNAAYETGIYDQYIWNGNSFDSIGNSAASINIKMDKENPKGQGSFIMNSNTSHSMDSSKKMTVVGDNNYATGEASYAEGIDNGSENSASHAEGYGTSSKGESSHTEGWYTIANNTGSHAEGVGTNAASYAQHVEGAYNLPDSNTKYIHIAGNGSDDDTLSNAYTLDWEGNGYFAGSITTDKAINIGNTTLTEEQLVALIHLLG